MFLCYNDRLIALWKMKSFVGGNFLISQRNQLSLLYSAGPD